MSSEKAKNIKFIIILMDNISIKYHADTLYSKRTCKIYLKAIDIIYRNTLHHIQKSI